MWSKKHVLRVFKESSELIFKLLREEKPSEIIKWFGLQVDCAWRLNFFYFFFKCMYLEAQLSSSISAVSSCSGISLHRHSVDLLAQMLLGKQAPTHFITAQTDSFPCGNWGLSLLLHVQREKQYSLSLIWKLALQNKTLCSNAWSLIGAIDHTGQEMTHQHVQGLSERDTVVCMRPFTEFLVIVTDCGFL